ncbi:putative Kunitz/Bovine pancreatic trypsin inhibitor domain protein [Trichinella nativa]|uniref:Putative Kunitz/Bovine pancreatic trypsin inhibitor domain protein n=1 Tax=Trichinella nativa TaxID=6335 RepID=A0A1Y3E958_9BILA|nr:putative Kunitz/Bovine pancreatic trypsin inhibitor domain protein [Trichinella nativa]
MQCSDDSRDAKVMPTTTCYDVSLFIFGKKKNSRPCAVDHLFARKWVTGSAVMQQNMAIDSGHTGAETVCRNRCQSPQRFSSAGKEIDPCERQPFQATCGSNTGRTIGRSQFVLRFYRRGDECVSYPYALCKGSNGQPELFKRKQDCEQACIVGSGPSPDSGHTERPKKLTSANVFHQMTTSPRVEEKSIDSSEQTVKPSVRSLTSKCFDFDSCSFIYELIYFQECQQQRQLALKANQANTDHVNIQTGVIYSCTADGAFEEIQCHEHSQICWCVDKDGVEIAGTRKQANEGRPDCRQKPIELQQNKPSGPICGPGISPLLEQSGQIYNCFGRACPKGYKCTMGPTMAACCPASSADDNQSASNLVKSTAKSCTLPKDRGTCNKFELRFYYSTEFKECKYFFYGGCGGNENNFKDLAECEKTCGKSSASSENVKPTTTSHQSTLPDINRCLHPKDSGPCNGRFIRWYWNDERKLCEVFHYGGCKGSGNNFGSREECLKECSPDNQKKTKVTVVQPATVEPIPFSVRPQLPSHATPRVETVTVRPQQVSSPAKSPDENVQKMENTVEVECKTKSCAPECLAITNGRGCVECMCPDLTALQVTKPRTPSHTTTSTSHPTSSPKVHEKIDEIPLQPISSSTKPVAKQPVKNETVDKCPCTGPVQPRWGFSSETGRCEKFDYTGCGGNMNHFYSLKECNIHCKAFLVIHPPGVHKSDDVSTKPHSTTTAETEKVTTSQASSIPTLTTAKPAVMVEQMKIAEDVDPVCSLPRDSGPCMDFMMKWFYNAVTGKCEQFQYGSCGGNSNNFDTEDMCKLRCVSGAHALGVEIPAACSEEKDPGPCFGYIVRFYYNPRNMRCEVFVYGGCGGNSNNFETKEACNQICPVYEKVWRNTASEQAQFTEPSLPISTKTPPDATDSESSISTTTHETNNDVETKISEMPTFFTHPGNTVSPMTHREPSVYQTPGAVMPGGVVENNYQTTVLNMIGAPTIPNYVPEPYEASAAVDGYNSVPSMPDYSVGNAQAETPTCPNGLPVRLGADGQPVLCLPGKTQCPPSSGCYFNGIDFFCCPEEEPQSFNFYLTAPPPQTLQPNSVDDTADGYPLRRVTRGVEVTNAVKRSADDMHPEEVGMNMLPNLPLVSPLKAPSLGMPYDQQQAVPIPSGNEAYANSQARPKELVNGIFGPNSDYRPVVPQPPTLSAGMFSSAGKRSPYCDEPKNPGPCKGSHLRFYYDKTIDDCRLFYYGGCQGNRNNFGTIDLCRQECVLRAKYTACPGGLLPLGGKISPVTCGASAGGIECPEDYVCHKGFFHICCPKYVENRDLPAGAPGHLPDPPKMAPMPEEVEKSKDIIAEANATTVQQVQQQSQQLQDRGGPPMFAMIQPRATSIDSVANVQMQKSPIQHQMLLNASSMANQQVPMMQRSPVMSTAMPQSNFAGHEQQMIQQNSKLYDFSVEKYLHVDNEIADLQQNAAVLNNPSVEKSMFSDIAHVESSLTPSPQGLPTTPVQMSPVAHQFHLPVTPVSENVQTVQPSLPNNHQPETQPALMSFPQTPSNVAESPTLFQSSQQQVQRMPAFGSQINVPQMPMELTMNGISQTPRPQLQTHTCHLPPDQGRRCSSSEQTPKSTVFYYFDISKNDCIILQYAGCGGNANRFSSRNDCFRLCHQGLPPLQP